MQSSITYGESGNGQHRGVRRGFGSKTTANAEDFPKHICNIKI